MAVKIGIITDIQGCDGEDNPAWSMGSPAEYRRYENEGYTYGDGERRFGEAIVTFNAQGVDVVIHPGDIIEYQRMSGDEARSTYVQAYISQGNGLNVDFYTLQGNHERSAYKISAGVYDTAAYYSDTAAMSGTMENVLTDDAGWKSYTFDVGDIRVIMLYTDINKNVPVDTLTWLENQLACGKPVVIATHCHLYHFFPYSWTWQSKSEDVRALIDAVDNVQAVLMGHYHWNGLMGTILNGVPYYPLGGSVLAPEPTDNVYYIFEITPMCVWKDGAMRANIKITGYGSRGTEATKAYDKYLVS